MTGLIYIAVGFLLAAAYIAVAAAAGGKSRQKLIFAVGLICAAAIYLAFGSFSNSVKWILIETLGVVIYAGVAFFGYRRSAWLLSFGWASHVLWDTVLHNASTDFVPFWYQMLCVGFDLPTAFYIAYREWRAK